jgi:hypothetical protein
MIGRLRKKRRKVRKNIIKKYKKLSGPGRKEMEAH